MTLFRTREVHRRNDHATWWQRALWPVADVVVVRRRRVPGPVRTATLRAFGARLGGGVVVGPDVRVRSPWTVRAVGPAWIGEGARITAPLDLERGACVADGARLGDEGPVTQAPTSVGVGAWVGAEAHVRPGTRIGDGAVVGTRAIVDGVVADGRTITGQQRPAPFEGTG